MSFEMFCVEESSRSWDPKRGFYTPKQDAVFHDTYLFLPTHSAAGRSAKADQGRGPNLSYFGFSHQGGPITAPRSSRQYPGHESAARLAILALSYREIAEPTLGKRTRVPIYILSALSVEMQRLGEVLTP
jgi:hypothetical protein